MNTDRRGFLGYLAAALSAFWGAKSDSANAEFTWLAARSKRLSDQMEANQVALENGDPLSSEHS